MLFDGGMDVRLCKYISFSLGLVLVWFWWEEGSKTVHESTAANILILGGIIRLL